MEDSLFMLRARMLGALAWSRLVRQFLNEIIIH